MSAHHDRGRVCTAASRACTLWSASVLLDLGCIVDGGTLLHVVGPVAHAVLEVEDQIDWTGHVMSTRALAHVVVGAIQSVVVVTDVPLRLLTFHLVLVLCKHSKDEQKGYTSLGPLTLGSSWLVGILNVGQIISFQLILGRIDERELVSHARATEVVHVHRPVITSMREANRLFALPQTKS